LKICPIFQKISKEALLPLAIQTEKKRFVVGNRIIKAGSKPDYLFIIRRGNVNVVKNIPFLKNTNDIKKEETRINKVSFILKLLEWEK
jgi:signal-transduction protein with cAMP-binding, CBS, and nucleotidyltransferase domain